MDVKKELKMKKIEMPGIAPVFLLIVFFVLPVVPLFSLDVSGTRWVSDPRFGYAPRLDFGADQSFMIGLHELMAEGTYSQTGNDITLNYTDAPGAHQEYIEKVGNKLSIVETDDFFCRYKLVGSGGMEFFNKAYRPPQGAKRTVDGIVVYVYDAAGTVNGDARMREGPGQQYKGVPDDDRPYDPNTTEGDLIVSKGEYVTVYGRSENQTTIGGVKAYWYYCCVVPDYRFYYGWIWGGLIDF
jgi:hypothetical protein